MRRNLGTIAISCAWIGVTFRVVAYQFSVSPHGAPEWVFDLDSVGFFIESMWPVCLSFTSGRRISSFIVPSVLFAYVVLFDACKELAGTNQSKTGMEIFLFWFFFFLTTITAYYVYKRRTDG